MFIDDPDDDDDDDDLEVSPGVMIGGVIIVGALYFGSRGKLKPGHVRKLLHFGIKGAAGFGGVHLGTRVGGHDPGSMANNPPHVAPLPPGPVPSAPPPAPNDITGQIAAAARGVLVRTYSRAISGAIAADPRAGVGITRTVVATSVLSATARKKVGKEKEENGNAVRRLQSGFVDLTASALPPDP